MVDSDAVQSANWEGCIPVIVTLAASSLSSPTLPPPIHVLVGRHNYLHLALEDAVRKLHEFAPTTMLFFREGGTVRNEPEPGESCGDSSDNRDIEKEESNSKDDDGKNTSKNSNTTRTSSDAASPAAETSRQPPSPYPICWFEDEDSQIALRWYLFAGVLYDMKTERSIPWRIRLNFTSYPSNQILPLERDQLVEQVRHYYKNSLKQALCIQVGNSKAAMSLTRENHGRLWDAIRTNNYGLYRLVAHQDFAKYDTQRIPVRLLIDSQAPIQRPCIASSSLTLGGYLAQEVPEWFETGGLPQDPASIKWMIAGLHQPPLDASILQLWLDLRHPDRFLHIIVVSS